MLVEERPGANQRQFDSRIICGGAERTPIPVSSVVDVKSVLGEGPWLEALVATLEVAPETCRKPDVELRAVLHNLLTILHGSRPSGVSLFPSRDAVWGRLFLLSLNFDGWSVLMYGSGCSRWLASVSLIVVLGCGPTGPRTPPGETVTLVILNGGAPITNAHVDLSNSGGGGDLNENGEVVIQSVPYGEYRVVVFPAVGAAEVIPTETTTAPAAAKKVAKAPDGGIPKPFRDESTTPFKISVQKGAATRISLDVKSP